VFAWDHRTAWAPDPLDAGHWNENAWLQRARRDGVQALWADGFLKSEECFAAKIVILVESNLVLGLYVSSA
jgi:hypothetical protein